MEKKGEKDRREKTQNEWKETGRRDESGLQTMTGLISLFCFHFNHLVGDIYKETAATTGWQLGRTLM